MLAAEKAVLGIEYVAMFRRLLELISALGNETLQQLDGRCLLGHRIKRIL
jgi:hypothetical protein